MHKFYTILYKVTQFDDSRYEQDAAAELQHEYHEYHEYHEIV